MLRDSKQTESQARLPRTLLEMELGMKTSEHDSEL